MQPAFDLSTFILLFGCFLSVLASILLFVYSYKKNIHNSWLSAYYFICGYALLVSFLLYSHFITRFPWFYTYRTGFIAGFLFMPVSLFYMRSLLQQKVFRRFDLIHFLPALVFTVDFFPYYLKQPAFKMHEALVSTQGLNSTWYQFAEGWLGIGKAYVPIRLAQGLFYWFWEITMIWQITKISNKKTFIRENRHIIQWAKLFCAAQGLYFLPYYLNMIFGPKDLFFAMQHVTSALGLAITALALLLKPDILYGLKGKWIPPIIAEDPVSFMKKGHEEMPLVATGLNPVYPLFEENDEIQVAIEENTGQTDQLRKPNYFSFQKMKEIDAIVQEHLKENKPYLNKRYSARHLSAEINIQPYLISAVINQVHQNHFNDFINKFRVDHAKSLIDSGKGKMFTLEALAEQSGFNNRNSFTLAFKKVTHCTPSGYIKGAVPA